MRSEDAEGSVSNKSRRNTEIFSSSTCLTGEPKIATRLRRNRLYQLQSRLSYRLHQRQSGELEQGHQQSQAFFHQHLRALLVFRTVIEPEQNERHLIEPEYVGELRLKIGGDFYVAALQSNAQVLNRPGAYWARL